MRACLFGAVVGLTLLLLAVPAGARGESRQKYQIEGEGFVWSHATMDSLEAIDHIDRIFLTVTESQWLPQWSFDFWIIPYLLGKGLTLTQFADFMCVANKLLAMNIATVPEAQQRALSREHMQSLVDLARDWRIN